MAIEHENLTSIHRFAFVGSGDPGAVGAFKAWVDTTATPHTLKIRDAGNTAWTSIAEINTASNIGAAGVGVFKQKTGANLEFRKINSLGSITVTSVSDTVRIDVDPSQLDITLIPGNIEPDRIAVEATSLVGNAGATPDVATSLAVGPGFDFTEGPDTLHLNLAIGTNLTTGTTGSIFYAGTSGIISQNNSKLFWDNTNTRLKLLDSAYTIPSSGKAYFTIGSSTTITNNTTHQYAQVIDIDRTSASGAGDNWHTIGLKTVVNKRSSGDFNTVIGGEFTVKNNNDSAANTSLYAIKAITECYTSLNLPLYASYNLFKAVTTDSGGSGTVIDGVGVLGEVLIEKGRTAVLASGFRSTIRVTGTGTISEARGLDISGWDKDVGANLEYAYGIYIGTNLDIADTGNYAIYSLSESPSVLTGDLSIGGTGKFYIYTSETPASAGAAGITGQIAWDTSYVYVCVGANTWKRSALSTW